MPNHLRLRSRVDELQPEKKSARWIIPPDLTTRAFFLGHLAGPCPIDFPPEIKIGTLGLAFLRLEFRGGGPR